MSVIIIIQAFARCLASDVSFLFLLSKKHAMSLLPLLLSLKERAVSLLPLLDNAAVSSLRRLGGVPTLAPSAVALAVPALNPLLLGAGVPRVIRDHNFDGLHKDVVDAVHLLAAALHILCAHLPRHRHALLLRDGREPLRFEKVDACSLGAEVGLQANEDERRVWAKVQDLGVPLAMVSYDGSQCRVDVHTLSMTFSRELGQSIAKQTNRRSVSG